MQTHYAILKISKKATKREIKRAFFKLCLRHHPDIKNKLGGELNELNNSKLNLKFRLTSLIKIFNYCLLYLFILDI